jgi:hypothetical protein
MSLKTQLERIRDRYFMKGTLSHHGDCEIYASENPHCSCGFEHDLRPLPEEMQKFLHRDIIEKILEEQGWVRSNSRIGAWNAEWESLQLIKEIFGKEFYDKVWKYADLKIFCLSPPEDVEGSFEHLFGVDDGVDKQFFKGMAVAIDDDLEAFKDFVKQYGPVKVLPPTEVFPHWTLEIT